VAGQPVAAHHTADPIGRGDSKYMPYVSSSYQQTTSFVLDFYDLRSNRPVSWHIRAIQTGRTHGGSSARNQRPRNALPCGRSLRLAGVNQPPLRRDCKVIRVVSCESYKPLSRPFARLGG